LHAKPAGVGDLALFDNPHPQAGDIPAGDDFLKNTIRFFFVDHGTPFRYAFMNGLADQSFGNEKCICTMTH
jgi:hypothetical protein